jgi:regulator of protease activity HflC (stomatin/prohibitin superfamily)
LNTALPAGSVGALQNNLPANMAMPAANTPVDLLFKVTGTQTSPKVSLTSVGKATFALLGQQAKDRAKAEADRIKNEAINKGKAEADKLKNEAEARVKAEAERLKNEAKNKAAEELKKLKGKFKL